MQVENIFCAVDAIMSANTKEEKDELLNELVKEVPEIGDFLAKIKDEKFFDRETDVIVDDIVDQLINIESLGLKNYKFVIKMVVKKALNMRSNKNNSIDHVHKSRLIGKQSVNNLQPFSEDFDII